MEEIVPTKKSFRQYIYFLLGQQFSILGSGIIGFVIVWYITIETQSPVYLSIATFLIFVPQVLVTPFAGVIADRISRKTIIIVVDLLQALLTFGLFLMFFTDLNSIGFILVIHTLRSVLQAFQVPTVQAIIPSMVPKEKLSRINGLNFLFSGVIYMIGPIVSALLLEIFPITQIFLIDIITFIIALVPLLMIKIPFQAKLVEKSERKSFKTDFFDGFKLVKSIPGLLALICFAMIFNFIFRPYNVLIPFVISSVHDGTAFNLAFLFGSWQVGNIIGSLICSIKKTWKNKIKVNIIGESIFFATNLIVILAPYRHFYLMMIGAFLGAIVFPMTVATYLTIFQERVPSDKIGRAMSLDHTISMAIAPIGALIAGPLASFMGITPLLVTCAIIGIVNPFFIWRFTKIRELENPQEIEFVPEKEPIKQELIEVKQKT